jgi:hypothetical protein
MRRQSAQASVQLGTRNATVLVELIEEPQHAVAAHLLRFRQLA